MGYRPLDDKYKAIFKLKRNWEKLIDVWEVKIKKNWEFFFERIHFPPVMTC
jgi:hypothetical protein